MRCTVHVIDARVYATKHRRQSPAPILYDVRITISGTPGSGKTTLARRLATTLGYPHRNAGQVFRDEAQRRGMSLLEFGRHVNRHLPLDRALDCELLHRARRHEDLILEGRLTGWLTYRARIPAFRVWVTAREATRVKRLMEREGETRATTLRKLRERARSEAFRYRANYGIDITDRAPYDCIVATDERTPAATLRFVLTAIRRAHPPTPTRRWRRRTNTQ